MGETVLHDFCWLDDERAGPEPCHVMSGFTRGAETCNLWTKTANLCQTDPVRRASCLDFPQLPITSPPSTLSAWPVM
jgi:hypothetical protein